MISVETFCTIKHTAAIYYSEVNAMGGKIGQVLSSEKRKM